MQANSWHHKLFHFHLSFLVWKVWKGKKYKKLNISRTKTAFEMKKKNIFHRFWRAIIWWKNINLIKKTKSRSLIQTLTHKKILIELSEHCFNAITLTFHFFDHKQSMLFNFRPCRLCSFDFPNSEEPSVQTWGEPEWNCEILILTKKLSRRLLLEKFARVLILTGCTKFCK